MSFGKSILDDQNCGCHVPSLTIITKKESRVDLGQDGKNVSRSLKTSSAPVKLLICEGSLYPAVYVWP